jgi:hypothetical protein
MVDLLAESRDLVGEPIPAPCVGDYRLEDGE